MAQIATAYELHGSLPTGPLAIIHLTTDLSAIEADAIHYARWAETTHPIISELLLHLDDNPKLIELLRKNIFTEDEQEMRWVALNYFTREGIRKETIPSQLFERLIEINPYTVLERMISANV